MQNQRQMVMLVAEPAYRIGLKISERERMKHVYWWLYMGQDSWKHHLMEALNDSDEMSYRGDMGEGV